MKAVDFSAQLKEAGMTLWAVGAGEPRVVVRRGHDGEEIPLSVVKVRSGRDGAFIILEIE